MSKKPFDHIADINRSVLSEEEKISALIFHVRSCDEACKELSDEAQLLKDKYDKNTESAKRGRAELKKYGIVIDNQFGGIQI